MSPTPRADANGHDADGCELARVAIVRASDALDASRHVYEALGRLTREVAGLGTKLEVGLRGMRSGLASVPDIAEDSAQHKIDDLRAEIEKRDAAKREAALAAQLEAAEETIRRAHERKWQILLEVAKYVIPLLIGAFLSHLAHLVGK